MLEQRRQANSRLASQNQRSTSTGTGAGEQSVQRRQLLVTIEQVHWRQLKTAVELQVFAVERVVSEESQPERAPLGCLSLARAFG
jgi:hypothetical protein